MTDLDKLEELAKAAGGDEWGTFDLMPAGKHEGMHVWDKGGDAVCECFANLGKFPEGVTELDRAEFIAAANPAAILALVAEVRALREELNQALLDAERARNERNRVGLEIRREWVSKCEALRADAERYRWLREQDSMPMEAAMLVKKRYGGEWCGQLEKLDGAIDAARGES